GTGKVNDFQEFLFGEGGAVDVVFDSGHKSLLVRTETNFCNRLLIVTVIAAAVNVQRVASRGKTYCHFCIAGNDCERFSLFVNEITYR
ncbi:MAG: hypothetical protein LBL27_05270, partial [Coriobacteriales bacterium]|nr:hypothetical protein [Coriobacteriales bacterium]